MDPPRSRYTPRESIIIMGSIEWESILIKKGKHHSYDLYTKISGGGIEMSRCFKNLAENSNGFPLKPKECQIGLVGSVGDDDEGRRILDHLNDLSIKASFVRIITTSQKKISFKIPLKTGQSLNVVEDGVSQRLFSSPGVNYHLCKESINTISTEQWRDSAICYVSTDGIPLGTSLRMLNMAYDIGVPLIVCSTVASDSTVSDLESLKELVLFGKTAANFASLLIFSVKELIVISEDDDEEEKDYQSEILKLEQDDEYLESKLSPFLESIGKRNMIIVRSSGLTFYSVNSTVHQFPGITRKSHVQINEPKLKEGLSHVTNTLDVIIATTCLHLANPLNSFETLIPVIDSLLQEYAIYPSILSLLPSSQVTAHPNSPRHHHPDSPHSTSFHHSPNNHFDSSHSPFSYSFTNSRLSNDSIHPYSPTHDDELSSFNSGTYCSTNTPKIPFNKNCPESPEIEILPTISRRSISNQKQQQLLTPKSRVSFVLNNNKSSSDQLLPRLMRVGTLEQQRRRVSQILSSPFNRETPQSDDSYSENPILITDNVTQSCSLHGSVSDNSSEVSTYEDYCTPELFMLSPRGGITPNAVDLELEMASTLEKLPKKKGSGLLKSLISLFSFPNSGSHTPSKERVKAASIESRTHLEDADDDEGGCDLTKW